MEHTPGLAAQVDWKEDMTLVSKHGEVIKLNLFLYVLSDSKLKYICLTFDRKQDTFFECLDDAFYYTGGVPEEIWFESHKQRIVRTHALSFQPLNYHSDDMFHILKSDVFAHRNDEEIHAYIKQMLNANAPLEDYR